MSASPPFNVLVAGGGAAALEAAFRLQRVAEQRVRTTILAPGEHLTTHARAVLVPFGAGAVPRVSLAGLASDAGARLRRGRMASVDSAEHQVITDDGAAIGYDALLIAIGAVPRTHPHALTFGGPGTEERMHGLIQDMEAGFVRRIAFVVPDDATWPVPLYELALLTAERAYDMCLSPQLAIITSETAPLALFGARSSEILAARLAGAGVSVRGGARAEIVTTRQIELHPGGERLRVDRIVTLPSFEGPAIPGLPHDARGYLPVDVHGRVYGAPDVYAAGDVTHHRIKQGGLACQQADSAADAIAARSGATIDPAPYVPALQGVLLTEHPATFLRREPIGDDEPPWWPPTKIAGRELSRHLPATGAHMQSAHRRR